MDILLVLEGKGKEFQLIFYRQYKQLVQKLRKNYFVYIMTETYRVKSSSDSLPSSSAAPSIGGGGDTIDPICNFSLAKFNKLTGQKLKSHKVHKQAAHPLSLGLLAN